MSTEAMKLALEALEANRRTHYYCEDTWYSCPKHEDGCANEAEGDDCNCGADSANAKIEKAITALREAIANEALDRMAENARELGLDYEPAQQHEPVAVGSLDSLKLSMQHSAWDGVIQLSDALKNIDDFAKEQPAQQEPYGQVTVVRRPGCVDQHWFYRWPEPPYLDNAIECHAVYTSPPAQRTWVGLTDEEAEEVWKQVEASDFRDCVQPFAQTIEAKLKEKNNG